MSVSLEKIDLLKKKFEVILDKNNIKNIKAQIVLVLDSTGSMRKLYKNNSIQELIEKMYAVADKLDDDGFLDVWIYDLKFRNLPDVSINNLDNYVEREIISKYGNDIFRKNNEPPVMEAVVKTYTKSNKEFRTTPLQRILIFLRLYKIKSTQSSPTLVIFITDGGVKKNSEIKNIIISSSNSPLFWQFVGFGNANYGILRDLDKLEGRDIDNSGFFAIDDYEKISDEELYERLMEEFPEWLKKVNYNSYEIKKLVKRSLLFYIIYFSTLLLILATIGYFAFKI